MMLGCACGDATTILSSSSTTHDASTQGSETLPTPTGGMTGSATGASTSADTGETGPEPFLAEPRWVLRDRDGQRVQALVEPRCGINFSGRVESMERCWPLNFDTAKNFPCVRVIDHESRFVNVEFELESGKLGPCHYDTLLMHGDLEKQWNELPGIAFLDDQCAGEPHGLSTSGIGYMNPEFTVPRVLYAADGDLWYLAEQGCNAGPFWYTDFPDPNCLYYGEAWQCPYKKVPEWVENLLPNPPYTLDVEYG